MLHALTFLWWTHASPTLLQFPHRRDSRAHRGLEFKRPGVNPGITTYQIQEHHVNYLNSLHLSVITDKLENAEKSTSQGRLVLNQELLTMPSTKQSSKLLKTAQFFSPREIWKRNLFQTKEDEEWFGQATVSSNYPCKCRSWHDLGNTCLACSLRPCGILEDRSHSLPEVQMCKQWHLFAHHTWKPFQLLGGQELFTSSKAVGLSAQGKWTHPTTGMEEIEAPSGSRGARLVPKLPGVKKYIYDRWWKP